MFIGVYKGCVFWEGFWKNHIFWKKRGLEKPAYSSYATDFAKI